jgi:4-hydroxybenzoate polyprenyltransferase
MSSSIKKYFSLVKFSHTVFALPFAIVGFLLAYQNGESKIDFSVLIFIVLCMVFARNSAMAFNRYIDRIIDKKNPRTEKRELPSGLVSKKSVIVFIAVNSLFFIATTYFINMLCFLLSPVALFVVLGYSFTKRFTAFCHLVLGLGLSLAPIGSYIAVTGSFDVLPVLFSLIVLFWVSGFDIIYAIQDFEFDKKEGLKSIPVIVGRRSALLISVIMHVISSFVLLYINMFYEFGIFFHVGSLLFFLLMLYQHILVKINFSKNVNLAFFTANGFASITFACFFIADYYFRIIA